MHISLLMTILNLAYNYCAMCNVQCAMCNVLCAMCNVQYLKMQIFKKQANYCK